MSSAADLLGPDGPFARRLAGYEARDGQLEVARAVERLLARDGVLLCEAGTGIGKTFAYLVPAILSGRKVVISTATKNLQDQIAERDLPRVLDVLGWNVEVAVMKGLSNYLCRRRYKEFLLGEEARKPGVARELELLRHFVRETQSGDLSDLVTLGENAKARLEVASSSETRIGPNCPEFERCFVTEMRRAADAAQIVIVNHHLFFADLALRGPHAGRVLPDYDAVLFDEAHQIEDTAALFFGVRVTRSQLLRLARESERLCQRASPWGGPLGASSSIPAALARAVEAFFAGLAGELGVPSGAAPAPGAERSSEPGVRRAIPAAEWKGPRREAYATLDGALDDLQALLRSLATAAKQDAHLRELFEQTARRVDTAREGLESIVVGAEGRVTWLDASSTQMALSSTPVDLAHLLQSQLFDRVPAVGLLSATLSTSARPGPGGFGFTRSRLGLAQRDDVTELSVPSPFSYDKQCLLYLPEDLPEVRAREFLERATERVAELVRLLDGGAFVLTTSLTSMRRLHDGLRQLLTDHPLLLQGQLPKEALIAQFRASGRAVLVATSSFWEGVDVPGSALRLVVLEKLPFSVPTDPVVQARAGALEERGLSAFAHLSLPSAAITLKQGFGRLIRRADDEGVVALLDERIVSKPYGKRLLAALPPARRTARLEDVERFGRTILERRARHGD